MTNPKQFNSTLMHAGSARSVPLPSRGDPGTRRSVYAGYSSPECVCPLCHSAAHRVPRRLVDLLMSMFKSVSRYRCHSRSCQWEGNLRVKQRALLIQGPW